MHRRPFPVIAAAGFDALDMFGALDERASSQTKATLGIDFVEAIKAKLWTPPPSPPPTPKGTTDAWTLRLPTSDFRLLQHRRRAVDHLHQRAPPHAQDQRGHQQHGEQRGVRRDERQRGRYALEAIDVHSLAGS
jgi:hypothetical protein